MTRRVHFAKRLLEETELPVSRTEAEEMNMAARLSAGWVSEEDLRAEEETDEDEAEAEAEEPDVDEVAAS